MYLGYVMFPKTFIRLPSVIVPTPCPAMATCLPPARSSDLAETRIGHPIGGLCILALFSHYTLHVSQHNLVVSIIDN